MVLATLHALAQVPVNDNPYGAVVLSNVSSYCSAAGAYNNVGATSHYTDGFKDVFFKFTATAYDVSITVTANGNNGLSNPGIELFEADSTAQLVGSLSTGATVSTLYKGGLTIGNTYYIRIYGTSNNNTGTFQLCVNNYFPILKAGQDYATASVLCSKTTFTQTGVVGAGNNNRESVGTCLDVGTSAGQSIEANTAWYKWTAANNGTLTFTITPTVTAPVADDIDWVLYDLGTTGKAANVTAANAIRCASGSGVQCSAPYNYYYKTGMDFNSNRTTESPGCVTGQTGFTKYIDMVQGHVYALLINNFSSGNNGFTLEFGGTGEFVGPKAAFAMTGTAGCSANQTFTFTNQSTGYSKLKWSFGDGASIDTASGNGPYTIKYSTYGQKTVVLEASTAQGCVNVADTVFFVALKPATPTITANKTTYCVGDSLVLSAPQTIPTKYYWSGPDGFNSTQNTASLKITSKAAAGRYTLVIGQYSCLSDTASIVIDTSQITLMPAVGFMATPRIPGRLSVPSTVVFNNTSTNATSYVWNFGDGGSSTQKNPTHIYLTKGDFTVTLTATNKNLCSSSSAVGTLVLRYDVIVFIPNLFTPNGDGINDYFTVSITNMLTYHLDVFNRLGKKLFASDSMSNRWDGNYQGQPVPIGTYYYVVEGLTINGDKLKQSGYVAVVR